MQILCFTQMNKKTNIIALFPKCIQYWHPVDDDCSLQTWDVQLFYN